jgi:hypothetical protein
MPRAATPIIVEAVKLGDEWHVLARHPSGQQEHVRRFKSEREAKNWIARESKAWLKKRRMVSRGGLPQTIFCGEELSRRSFDRGLLALWRA